MKILIAPNSFKNSLSSVEVVQIIHNELGEMSSFELLKFPLSDGGDGFLDVIDFFSYGKFEKKYYELNFANKVFNCPTLFDKSNGICYIESAEAIGLKRIFSDNLNPLKINSASLGILIKKVIEDFPNEVKEIIIGIGGTATIDFGFGALNKLGFEFINENNQPINPIPENFNLIKGFIQSDYLKTPLIKFVVDVNTKLLGQNNAIEIYGFQKGADREKINFIESGIKKVIELLQAKGFSFNEFELNGAGGGIAAGFNIFLSSEIVKAKDFIIKELMRKISLTESDYIITGEGKFDIQSFEGKITGEIIKAFNQTVKRIFIICGLAEKNIITKLPPNVEVIQISEFFNSIDDSIRNSSLGIKKSIPKIIKQILSDI